MLPLYADAAAVAGGRRSHVEGSTLPLPHYCSSNIKHPAGSRQQDAYVTECEVSY